MNRAHPAMCSELNFAVMIEYDLTLILSHNLLTKLSFFSDLPFSLAGHSHFGPD